MNKSVFDSFWEKIVNSRIDYIISKTIRNNHSEIEIPTKLDQKSLSEWKHCIRDQVFEQYNTNRELFSDTVNKALFQKLEKEKKNNLFDRHKLSSLFMLSIMQVKPFKISRQLRSKTHEFYWYSVFANHDLAFHIGVAITHLFPEYHRSNSHNQTFNPDKIRYPETSYNNYEENIFIMLSLIGKCSVLQENVLMLSKIFFHIEEYNNRD